MKKLKISTSCPMTDETVEKYKLTDKEIKNFCDKGCSVMCKELFIEYVERLKRRVGK